MSPARSSLRAVALVALVASGALVAACSSKSTSPGDASGAFVGTFSADSSDGAAPFDSITFLDALHYSYIARGCGDTGTDGGAGDPADDGPSVDLSSCVHAGSYVVETAAPGGADMLVLTDEGQSASVVVELAITAMTASGDSLTPQSLVAGGSDLVNTSTGAGSVQSFSAGGTSMTKSSSAPPLVNNGYVGQAMEWASVKMPYCQAVNHAKDDDKDCVAIHGPVCNRTGAADNPEWNGYRSDCSGLVSFAWGLAAPGLNTNHFVPNVASYIPASTLAAGDALLSPGQHIGLFERWIDQSAGRAMMVAEPGCSAGSPYAQEQEWKLTSGGAPGATPSASWNDGKDTKTFFAIRKHG